MKILEVFSESKLGDESLNEDTIVITNQWVAVFDGETNKGEHTDPSPGRLAAQACAAVVPSIAPGTNPVDIASLLHSAVRELGIGTDAATVGAVFDVVERRVTRIGDITVGINGKFDMFVSPSKAAAAVARTAYLKTLLEQGVPEDELRRDDPGREMVMPLLKAQKVWRNIGNDWGFGSVDGTQTPPELVDVFEVPAGAELILASDGYIEPKTTLEKSEAALSKTIQLDPMRILGRPGGKGVTPEAHSFDDRSYIRLIA